MELESIDYPKFKRYGGSWGFILFIFVVWTTSIRGMSGYIFQFNKGREASKLKSLLIWNGFSLVYMLIGRGVGRGAGFLLVELGILNAGWF